MPSYTHIQTYSTCDPGTFSDILHRYQQVLEKLGCKDRRVLDWIIQVAWPKSDDDAFGDIYAAPVTLTPAKQEHLPFAGIEVSLYAESAVPSIDEPPCWVGFNLLLERNDLEEGKVLPYPEEVGYTLWAVLRELFAAFPELGVYVTDEWQENLAWRALVEKTGDPWVFELAIFPRALANAFEAVPAGFQGTVIDGAFGFAQANRWQTLPWSKDNM